MHNTTGQVRSPQNLMTVGAVLTSLVRTLTYASKPIPKGILYLFQSLKSISSFTNTIFIQTFIINLSHSPLDHYFHKILATISNDTCITFEPVMMNVKLNAKVKDYVCYLNDLDFRSVAIYTHIDIVLTIICITCWLSFIYRRTKEQLGPKIFRRIFGCLGKLYEHQRMDRDRYIDIHWENMRSCEFQSLEICSNLAGFNHFFTALSIHPIF